MQAVGQVRWKPRSMSFIDRRRITGRPCGQVVGDEVVRSRSISQCIFSGVSFMLILMAALHASDAAISSRNVDLPDPRFSRSILSNISAKRFLTSAAGRSVGIDLIATVLPDNRINPKP